MEWVKVGVFSTFSYRLGANSALGFCTIIRRMINSSHWPGPLPVCYGSLVTPAIAVTWGDLAGVLVLKVKVKQVQHTKRNKI